VDSLLGVMVHPAALVLHCRTCPTVFLPRGFQRVDVVNARPDPVAYVAYVFKALSACGYCALNGYWRMAMHLFSNSSLPMIITFNFFLDLVMFWNSILGGS